MTQQLTQQDIKDVADLAQLALSDAQVAQYQKDLESILAYFDTLQECDTDHVEEIGHITGMTNVFRADEAKEPDEEMVDAMIAAFPSRQDRLIKVKNVL